MASSTEQVQSLLSTAQADLQQGRPAAALEALAELLAIDAGNIPALTMAAAIHLAHGQPETVLDLGGRILAQDPDSAEGHQFVGSAALKMRDFSAAVRHLEAALEINPGQHKARTELGFALLSADNPEAAIPHLRRVLSAQPDALTHEYLAAALLASGDHPEALENFRLAGACKQKEDQQVRGMITAQGQGSALHFNRLQHGFEQLGYLRQRGILAPEHAPLLDMLAELLERAHREGVTRSDQTLLLSAAELQRILPLFDTALYVGDGSRIDGSTINPDIDRTEIEQQYFSSQPEILYIDQLLTQPALSKLRRFLLESTIYARRYDGYFGATLATGLASPLIFQICEDLRHSFPGIFRDYPLTQGWAFMHQQGKPGVNVHADFAVVNVNFWITPDTANLNPETGGLVLWDEESPADWRFDDYQSNEEKIYGFLAERQANAVRIPFRQNRAAIFNSTLFHVTDKPEFKAGYENRRLNLTFLFGRRLRL